MCEERGGGAGDDECVCVCVYFPLEILWEELLVKRRILIVVVFKVYLQIILTLSLQKVEPNSLPFEFVSNRVT